MFDHLPNRVFLDCGLSVDRWYPQSRQLLGALKFLASHRREAARARRCLETLRERFDLRCGPLPA